MDTFDLHVAATVGVLAVAVGVLLVILSHRGVAMAIQRSIEFDVKRIDAHGNHTANVEFVARQINGTVILEFHGERVYRFEMTATDFDNLKKL